MRRRIGCWCTLLVSLSMMGVAAAQSAGDLYDLGSEQAVQGNLKEARAAFEQAVQADPQDWSSATALEIVRDAESGQIPPDLVVHMFKSFMLGNEGSWDEAIAEADAAIALDPEYGGAYNSRGNIHGMRGQTEQAVADYSKAITLNPQDAEAHHSRGAMRVLAEEYDQALADFTRAIELNPQYSMSYFGRGIVYANDKRDYDQALADFARALELDPDFEDVYVNRALIYAHAKRDFARAIDDYRKVLEINPARVEQHLHIANAYEQSGRSKEAIEAYRAFIADAPSEQADVVEQARQRIGELEQQQ